MYSEFVEEWKIRFIKEVCTKEHLDRLLRINRLTTEEYNHIITEKEKEGQKKEEGK